MTRRLTVINGQHQRLSAEERRAELERVVAEWRAVPWRQRSEEQRAAAAAAAERLVFCADIVDQDETAACDQAGAWKSCPFFSAGHGRAPSSATSAIAEGVFCHRDEALASWRKHRRNVAAAPPRYAQTVLEAEFWRELGDGRSPEPEFDPAPAKPLLDTDALIAARAFFSRVPRRLTLSGQREVEFRGDETWLLLAGTVGTGKSLAAAWLLSRLKGRWCRAADLVRIGSDIDPDEVANTEGLLVLDDLGQEHVGQSDYAPATIDRIVSRRYDLRRRLVITSNLSRKALGERFGERFDDRLEETGVYVPCVGDSLRRRPR